MRSLPRLTIALVLATLANVSLGAQTRSTWSVQGSGLFAGLGGGGQAYDGLDPGFGLELQARRKLTALWSIGCGFQGTYHSYSQLGGNVRFEGGFCEPRRLIDVGSDSWFPYISARGALLWRNDSDDTGFEATANGVAGNVGAGIMLPIGSPTTKYPFVLEFGASAGYTSFGELTGHLANGTAITPRSGGSGYNFIVRVGIAVGLPTGSP